MVTRRRVLVILCLVLALACCEVSGQRRRNGKNKLNKMKDGHKPKKLTQSKLRQFSALTDIDRFMGPDRLDPFLKERVPGTLGNIQVRQYIVNSLRNLGSWDIEEDRFEDSTPKGTKEFVNIIATLRNPNQEPESDLKLVMACHYDSKLFPRDTFIGATDSAVPCAMLLDLAHNLRGSFAAKTYQLYTLQLIFFDGEEAFEQWSSADSLYGSRHLAQKWAEMPHHSHNAGLLDGIGLFVLLDLLGAPQPKIQNHYPNSLSGRTFSHLKNIEQRLAQANELTSYNRNNPYFVDSTNYAGKIDDDHRPFLRKGVDDILHVIATPFPRVWHTPSDNESNLDRDTISNLSKIFHVFVAEFLHLKPPE